MADETKVVMLDMDVEGISSLSVYEKHGGYAALMALVRTPGLFRCAVVHAPVSDLPAFLADRDGPLEAAAAETWLLSAG